MPNLNLNNRGFSRKETMICLLLIIFLMVIALNGVIKAHSSTKYNNFKRLASDFVNKAIMLRDTEIDYSDKKIYLFDLINEGYLDEISSPFDKDGKCDKYESFIDSSDRFSFKCGKYLIYNQNLNDLKYKIYEVSNWTSEELEGENVQTTTLYNYETNGVIQLNDYIEEKQFLNDYRENTGYDIDRIVEIKPEHNILKKTYYRTIKEVE